MAAAVTGSFASKEQCSYRRLDSIGPNQDPTSGILARRGRSSSHDRRRHTHSYQMVVAIIVVDVSIVWENLKGFQRMSQAHNFWRQGVCQVLLQPIPDIKDGTDDGPSFQCG
eukprot:scaffold271796_cov53-Attheya_sp.AAC.2